jgi:hypothetical protein
VVRGNIAANQKRDSETISIEKLYEDVTMELTAWAVLLKKGIVSAEDIPYRDARTQKAYIHTLLKDQWSDRWIKAVNKKRRAHPPKTRTKGGHGSVQRILQRNAEENAEANATI